MKETKRRIHFLAFFNDLLLQEREQKMLIFIFVRDGLKVVCAAFIWCETNECLSFSVIPTFFLTFTNRKVKKYKFDALKLEVKTLGKH